MCAAPVHRRVQKCSPRSRVMSRLTLTFQIREILINAEWRGEDSVRIKAATGHGVTFCIWGNGGGGVGGVVAEGGNEGAAVDVGGSKRRMVAECCPLLWRSDKDRLAPQVWLWEPRHEASAEAPITEQLTNIS